MTSTVRGVRIVTSVPGVAPGFGRLILVRFRHGTESENSGRSGDPDGTVCRRRHGFCGRPTGIAGHRDPRRRVPTMGDVLPPARSELFGGGRNLFPDRRFVALYGHPGGPALGAFGEQDTAGAITRVRDLAASISSSRRSRCCPHSRSSRPSHPPIPVPTGAFRASHHLISCGL